MSAIIERSFMLDILFFTSVSNSSYKAYGIWLMSPCDTFSIQMSTYIISGNRFEDPGYCLLDIYLHMKI